MRRFLIVFLLGLVLALSSGQAYIEAPHSLGKCVNESTNIVLMEVTKVNAEKGLVMFKKIADLKGKHPVNEIKHNIGKRGFHEREWKNVMAWAEPGKKAIFMYNGDASETCIGTYWYQCYRESEWWGMSHAEPFLLRTFYGDIDKLSEILAKIIKGDEVAVPCLADGNKNQLHERKGKLQRLKASLKKLEYDPKRDFIGFGGLDGDEADEFKKVELIKVSSKGWRFLPAKDVAKLGEKWIAADFDDSKWREGKTPIGYGEDEIKTRQGTTISEVGVDFVFRRTVEIPAETLSVKDIKFFLNVASDDHARVYLNGQLIDQDPVDDHEFAYWNREIAVPLKSMKPGKNVFAILVKNKAKSSDLYLDAELIAQTPILKKPKPKTEVVVTNPKETPKTEVTPSFEEFPKDPAAMQIDKAKKTVTINGVVALRKLPNLDQKYPIEVIATYPHPRGQKAHETVMTFKGVKPSEIHAALTQIGLKPGKPAYGDNTKAEGPEVRVYIEVTSADGKKTERLPIEKCLIHQDTGKPMAALKWHFTGAIMKQPDPEKEDKVYGADLTGTLLSLFPVTDCCVLQTQLTMKDEPNYKLEVNGSLLPKEGSSIKLILAVE